MPGEEFGLGAKVWNAVGKPIMAALRRHRQMGDQELAEHRTRLNDLLAIIEESSVQSQMAVRGSANDPATAISHAAAVELSTRVGQRTVDLFDLHTVGGGNGWLTGARLRYREAVTDEDNPSIGQPDRRSAQCERIEQRANEFHSAIRDEAFRRWGQGVGAKAGKMGGRRDPK